MSRQVQYARPESVDRLRPQAIDLRQQMQDRRDAIDQIKRTPVDEQQFQKALRELPGRHVSYDRRIEHINKWVEKHGDLISDPRYYDKAIRKIDEQQRYLDRTARQEWEKLDLRIDPSLSYNERVDKINQLLSKHENVITKGQNIERAQEFLQKEQQKLDTYQEAMPILSGQEFDKSRFVTFDWERNRPQLNIDTNKYSVQYHPSGRIKSIKTKPQTYTSEKTFDERGRLTEKTGTYIAEEIYFDTDGNITQRIKRDVALKKKSPGKKEVYAPVTKKEYNYGAEGALSSVREYDLAKSKHLVFTDGKLKEFQPYVKTELDYVKGEKRTAEAIDADPYQMGYTRAEVDRILSGDVIIPEGPKEMTIDEMSKQDGYIRLQYDMLQRGTIKEGTIAHELLIDDLSRRIARVRGEEYVSPFIQVRDPQPAPEVTPIETSPVAQQSAREFIQDFMRTRHDRIRSITEGMDFSGLIQREQPKEIDYKQKAITGDILTMQQRIFDVQERAQDEGPIAELITEQDFTPYLDEYTPRQKEFVQAQYDTRVTERELRELTKALETKQATPEYKRLVETYFATPEKAERTTQMIQDYEQERQRLISAYDTYHGTPEYQTFYQKYYSTPEKAKRTTKMLEDYEAKRDTLIETPKEIQEYIKAYERVPPVYFERIDQLAEKINYTPEEIQRYIETYEKVDPALLKKIDKVAGKIDTKAEKYELAAERLGKFYDEEQKLYSAITRMDEITGKLTQPKAELIGKIDGVDDYVQWRGELLKEYGDLRTSVKDKDLWGVVAPPEKDRTTREKVSDFFTVTVPEFVSSLDFRRQAEDITQTMGIGTVPVREKPVEEVDDRFPTYTAAQLRKMAPHEREIIMIREGPPGLYRYLRETGTPVPFAAAGFLFSGLVKGAMFAGEVERKRAIVTQDILTDIYDTGVLGDVGGKAIKGALKVEEFREGIGEYLAYNPDFIAQEIGIGVGTWGIGKGIQLYGAKQAARTALLTRGVSTVDKAKKITDRAKWLGYGMVGMYGGMAGMEIAAAPAEERFKEAGRQAARIGTFFLGTGIGVGIGRASERLLGPMDTKFKMRVFEGGFRSVTPWKIQSPITIKAKQALLDYKPVNLFPMKIKSPVMAVDSYEVTFRSPVTRTRTPTRVPKDRLDLAYKEFGILTETPGYRPLHKTFMPEGLARHRAVAARISRLDYDEAYRLGQEVRTLPKPDITPKLRKTYQMPGYDEFALAKGFEYDGWTLVDVHGAKPKGPILGDAFWSGDRIKITKMFTKKLDDVPAYFRVTPRHSPESPKYRALQVEEMFKRPSQLKVDVIGRYDRLATDMAPRYRKEIFFEKTRKPGEMYRIVQDGSEFKMFKKSPRTERWGVLKMGKDDTLAASDIFTKGFDVKKTTLDYVDDLSGLKLTQTEDILTKGRLFQKAPSPAVTLSRTQVATDIPYTVRLTKPDGRIITQDYSYMDPRTGKLTTLGGRRIDPGNVIGYPTLRGGKVVRTGEKFIQDGVITDLDLRTVTAETVPVAKAQTLMFDAPTTSVDFSDVKRTHRLAAEKLGAVTDEGIVGKFYRSKRIDDLPFQDIFKFDKGWVAQTVPSQKIYRPAVTIDVPRDPRISIVRPATKVDSVDFLKRDPLARIDTPIPFKPTPDTMFHPTKRDFYIPMFGRKGKAELIRKIEPSKMVPGRADVTEVFTVQPLGVTTTKITGKMTTKMPGFKYEVIGEGVDTRAVLDPFGTKDLYRSLKDSYSTAWARTQDFSKPLDRKIKDTTQKITDMFKPVRRMDVTIDGKRVPFTVVDRAPRDIVPVRDTRPTVTREDPISQLFLPEQKRPMPFMSKKPRADVSDLFGTTPGKKPMSDMFVSEPRIDRRVTPDGLVLEMKPQIKPKIVPSKEAMMFEPQIGRPVSIPTKTLYTPTQVSKELFRPKTVPVKTKPAVQPLLAQTFPFRTEAIMTASTRLKTEPSLRMDEMLRMDPAIRIDEKIRTDPAIRVDEKLKTDPMIRERLASDLAMRELLRTDPAVRTREKLRIDAISTLKFDSKLITDSQLRAKQVQVSKLKNMLYTPPQPVFTKIPGIKPPAPPKPPKPPRPPIVPDPIIPPGRLPGLFVGPQKAKPRRVMADKDYIEREFGVLDLVGKKKTELNFL